MADSEIPRPSGSSSFERAASEASETCCLSLSKQSTARFTNSTVRSRLEPKTFSVMQGRPSVLPFNLDFSFTAFVPLIGFDQIHFGHLNVTITDQLFHPLSLRVEPFLHPKFRPN